MKKEKVILFVSYVVINLCIIFLSNVEANSQNQKPTIPTTTPTVSPPELPRIICGEPKTADPVPNKGGGTPGSIGAGIGGGDAYGRGIGGNGTITSFNPPIRTGTFKWERVVSSNANFSIELPSNFDKISESFEYPLDGDENIIITERQTVSSFLNETIFIFDIYRTNNSKNAMKKIRDDYFIRDSQANCSETKINDLKSIKCESQTESYKVKEQYFYDKEFVYVIAAYAQGVDTAMLEHFISSIKYKDSKAASGSEELKVNVSLDENKIYKSSEATQKAKLILKPQPVYTYEARKNQVQGVVRLSAVLRADGYVGSIRAISHLPDGLTERAISAMKRVKFLPAQKDGKRVSQYVTVEYNFRIY